MCCYKVLQIQRNSTDKEIKDAFLRLAKLYHPDINKGLNAPEDFRQVHEAYTSLRTAQARSLYEISVLEEARAQNPFHYAYPSGKPTHGAKECPSIHLAISSVFPSILDKCMTAHAFCDAI